MEVARVLAAAAPLGVPRTACDGLPHRDFFGECSQGIVKEKTNVFSNELCLSRKIDLLTPPSAIKGLPHLLPLDELLRLREPHRSYMDSTDNLGSRRVYQGCTVSRCPLSITPNLYIHID